MKNITSILFCCLFGTNLSVFAQLVDCEDSNTGVVSSGNIMEYCNGTLKSNVAGVSFENLVVTEYKSDTQMHLRPGFHAGDFSGSANFHAYVDILSMPIINPATNYEQYEKIEFSINILNLKISRYHYDSNWGNQTLLNEIDLNADIDNFFNESAYPNPYTNPYDSDDIDIEVTFKNLSTQKIFKTTAFYYRGFDYDITSPSYDNLPKVWIPNLSDIGWRVRFAPPEEGDYVASVRIKCYGNTAHQTIVRHNNASTFNVIPSSNDGYLKFNTGSKYMSFSNNSNRTFVPVGYNLIGDYDYNSYTDYPAEYYFNQTHLQNLIGRGNYVRVATGPNYWVEFDKPGNYDSHQTHMWELDQILKIAEENDVYVLLSLMIWEQFMTGTENAYDPFGSDVGYRLSNDGNNQTRDFFGEHPYREKYQFGDNVATTQGIIDNTNPLTDFFKEVDSKKLLKNKLRYIISRWGYSTHISAYDLLGEIDNVILKRYVDNNGQIKRYFNQEAELGLAKEIYDWVDEMTLYLKKIDNNHLITINKFSHKNLPDEQSQYDVFDLQSIDYAAFNDYGSRRNHNVYRLDNVGEAINKYSKPIAIEEIGHANAHHISEMYFPENFHNSIWSSAFTGVFGPGAYWYKGYFSDIGAKKSRDEYNSLYSTNQSSYNGVNFEVLNVKASDYFWPGWYKITDDNCFVRLDLNGSPISGWDDPFADDITPDFTYHLITLTDFFNDIIYNNDVNLQNDYTPQYYPSNDLYIDSQDYDDDNELEALMLVDNNKEKVVGWVHNRSNYWGNFDFASAFNDGYQGVDGFSGGSSGYFYDGSTLSPPDLEDDNVNYVIQYSGVNMPSFQVTGLDPNRSYSVKWYNTLGTNNNGGITSPSGSPTITSTTSSTGILTVVPPDMTDIIAHDYAFIITGGFLSQRGRYAAINDEKNGNINNEIEEINIYPNPNKGKFTLDLGIIDNESYLRIEIINSLGSIVYDEKNINTKLINLTIEDSPNGVYFVKIISKNNVKIKKVIKN